jgi:hypothetical protein
LDGDEGQEEECKELVHNVDMFYWFNVAILILCDLINGSMQLNRRRFTSLERRQDTTTVGFWKDSALGGKRTTLHFVQY